MAALLDAGADATARNAKGEIAWDLVQDNRALEGTAAYQLLAGLPSRPTCRRHQRR